VASKSKAKISYVCQECGYDTPSWMGKCPECGNWNTLKEFKTQNVKTKSDDARSDSVIAASQAAPQKLSEITYQEKLRIQTQFRELDTVLGGGLVSGSATLLAGDPGIGKSTLLLQLCLSLAQSGKTVLYISGEESSEQIKLRADRILANSTKQTVHSKKAEYNVDTLLLISLSDPDIAITHIESLKPDLVVVDSVQTMQSANLEGLSGSVGQVRYAALHFIRTAKALSIPLILVGHVTKEGTVAGPMVLSHMVDTVLFLEGERYATTRLLRSLKNRFGPVDEVGVFSMEEAGMVEVTNPEQIFLTHSAPFDSAQGKSSGQAESATPGSVLVATLEGSRAFLVELQALVVYSKFPMPRRVVSGVDPRRVELLLAVLQKHVRLPVETMDVFVNVAGGLRITDPGVDLGVCLAIYSSLKNIVLPRTVGIAEVGLLGELRMVTGLEKRMREATKLGYTTLLTAQSHKTLNEALASLHNGA
jgi:DNA repair protein RadA/Sms